MPSNAVSKLFVSESDATWTYYFELVISSLLQSIKIDFELSNLEPLDYGKSISHKS